MNENEIIPGSAGGTTKSRSFPPWPPWKEGRRKLRRNVDSWLGMDGGSLGFGRSKLAPKKYIKHHKTIPSVNFVDTVWITDPTYHRSPNKRHVYVMESQEGFQAGWQVRNQVSNVQLEAANVSCRVSHVEVSIDIFLSLWAMHRLFRSKNFLKKHIAMLTQSFRPYIATSTVSWALFKCGTLEFRHRLKTLLAAQKKGLSHPENPRCFTKKTIIYYTMHNVTQWLLSK